jgi:hypothetical protein
MNTNVVPFPSQRRSARALSERVGLPRAIDEILAAESVRRFQADFEHSVSELLAHGRDEDELVEHLHAIAEQERRSA